MNLIEIWVSLNAKKMKLPLEKKEMKCWENQEFTKQLLVQTLNRMLFFPSPP